MKRPPSTFPRHVRSPSFAFLRSAFALAALASSARAMAQETRPANDTKNDANNDGRNETMGPEGTHPSTASGSREVLVGARYRGTVLPGFLLSPFVRDERSFYFHSAGIEAEFRKDGFSIVPALSFSEFGTGDVLFADKTRNLAFAGNWSVANSGLKGVFATVDLLWSVNLPKNLAFEYGLGVGAGVLFGDLVINWVYDDPNGPFEGSNGKRYQTCRTQADGVGCRVQDHENASTARVGGYAEPSWVNGGAKPNFLPHLSLPQVGLRFQPMREVQGRIGVGWSLTGFWFGVGIHYGLPSGQKP